MPQPSFKTLKQVKTPNDNNQTTNQSNITCRGICLDYIFGKGVNWSIVCESEYSTAPTILAGGLWFDLLSHPIRPSKV